MYWKPPAQMHIHVTLGDARSNALHFVPEHECDSGSMNEELCEG